MTIAVSRDGRIGGGIRPIYRRSRTPSLDPSVFADPPAEYRGAPFWAWNGPLNLEELKRQIGMFRRMGIGGFHMHVRTGLDLPYLGSEYMRRVRHCIEVARHEQMLAWLYDEDRWPSGFAGGMVTSEPAYRARQLLWTCRPYRPEEKPQGENDSNASGARTGQGRLIGRYAVTLADGVLRDYRPLDGDEPAPADAAVWYAYLEVAIPVPWFNHQTYVDTLNPAAIRRFIEVTHERYRAVVGDAFGGVVPAIFTDEPQFIHKGCLASPDADNDVVLPWTDDLLQTYAEAYGQRLEEHLPELYWELPDGRASVVRYRYHDHVCERFTQAFMDQVGRWCDEAGIALTGHMMEEPTLRSQTHALGEAMRSYRSMHLPGIDMLCDAFEFTTAKQAQSAARQFGREGVMSELYGVTGWHFDFTGHKRQGDWQAALGVTLRVHHLTWVTMAGEAKRDYPASIGYQSPWWTQYPVVEDHFARLNAVLTRGRPIVHLAVIHPIESFWLSWGPEAQTRDDRQRQEQAFKDVTAWLLHGLVDFDFVAESLLSELGGEVDGDALRVGEMRYRAVLISGLRTIRRSTFERLAAFVDVGGLVIFAGGAPELVDAEPSDEPRRLAARCMKVDLAREAILAAVEPAREVRVTGADGAAVPELIHQYREDADGSRYLFICNMDRDRAHVGATLEVRGGFAVERLDTHTGRIEPISVEKHDGWTRLPWDIEAAGSLLLRLTPASRSASTGGALRRQPLRQIATIDGPLPITLHEPNLMMLDRPAWRVDDGAWQPEDESLRVTNHVRQQLGLEPFSGQDCQPWADTQPVRTLATVELRFVIETSVPVVRPMLAIEERDVHQIAFDGVAVPNEDAGWWVDRAIRTVVLPDLSPGRHELTLRRPFDRKTSLEWCYLLGDFGVTVEGARQRLTAPVRQAAFGDLGPQGLPFYAGNVTYRATMDAPGGGLVVDLGRYAGPTATVSLGGGPERPVAFPPYRADLGVVAAERHRLDITLYGHRGNAFGPLHHADRHVRWIGPGAWRSQGERWTDGYTTHPLGLLTPPTLHTC